MNEPEPIQTYSAVIDRAAVEFGELEAIADGEVRLSFAELGERIDRCAAALIALNRTGIFGGSES